VPNPVALASLIALASGCLESPPDGDGVMTADARPAADASEDPFDCPGNLVVNASFEDGTANWLAVNGDVTTVDDAAVGSFAAEMCFDGDPGVGYYTLDDTPPAVANPSMGEKYVLTAWVRAGPQNAPQTVEVVVREHDESGAPHPFGVPISPDGEWRKVETSLTVESENPMNVDVYAGSTSAEEGNCFQVDAFCLVRRGES
jgi:hypothetical protein